MAALTAANVKFAVDPLLVRGLDYYNRTVFEVVPDDDERAQGTIGGGGRYDGLVELLGGPPTPGIGFGTGIERIILEMQKNGVTFEPSPAAEAFIVRRGEGTATAAIQLATALRDLGVATVVGEGQRSFKAQLRSANAAGARIALILGEDELAKGVVLLKPLAGEGEQEPKPLAAAPAEVARRLRG
jgi:histidyl-tRNA synthetase